MTNETINPENLQKIENLVLKECTKLPKGHRQIEEVSDRVDFLQERMNLPNYISRMDLSKFTSTYNGKKSKRIIKVEFEKFRKY